MLSDALRYRKVIHAIGLSMLVFWGLFMVYAFVIELMGGILFFVLPPVSAEVVYQILYGSGYLLTFMLPAWFLKLFLKGCHVPSEPMGLSLRLNKALPWILFGGIAIIYAAAEVNASMVSIFHYNEVLNEMMGADTSLEPYQWVLQCIVIGLVPGFCEEFLFRGAIQSNCRPFGRTVAILVSSLLFSLMHQNIGQSIYTFVAGLFLGLVYEMTGSIWPGVILHASNNITSVLQMLVYDAFESDLSGNAAILLMQAGIYLLGALSIGILILHARQNRPRYEDGIFAKALPASDAYARCPISAHEAIRGFFRPTMVIFFLLCIGQMLLLLLMVLMPTLV